MEYVSLLPPEIKAKKAAQQKQRSILFILFVLLLIIAVIYAFLMVSTFLIRQDLRSLQNERETLEEQAADLEEYEELYRQLTARERVVSEAMGTVPPWSDLLRDASRALPVGTWLSALSLSYAEDSGSMTMSGWAYDYSGVATTLDQLFTIDQLDQIQTRVSTETDYQGMQAVQFQVDGRILTGPDFLAVDQDDQDDRDDRGGE